MKSEDRELLSERSNGNVTVRLYRDGTREREWEGEACPEFPDSLDLKITDYCDLAAICGYCHEASTKAGQHASTERIAAMMDTVPSGVEIAIGGGNPLAHPELPAILEHMQRRGLIPNLTVNQLHCRSPILRDILERELIYGLGISWRDARRSVPEHVRLFPGLVLHLIAGVDDPDEVPRDWERVLVLGYKSFRKGADWHGTHVEASLRKWFHQLPVLVQDFPYIAFDNLAIEQLKVERLFCDRSDYERMYQGDEGTHSFYIDAVTETFALSSSSPERWPVSEEVADMFQRVRGRAG